VRIFSLFLSDIIPALFSMMFSFSVEYQDGEPPNGLRFTCAGARTAKPSSQKNEKV
jgi:hypothetical protein